MTITIKSQEEINIGKTYLILAHLERVWVKMSYKLLIIYRKIREKRSFR
jgi:hypothetical protein